MRQRNIPYTISGRNFSQSDEFRDYFEGFSAKMNAPSANATAILRLRLTDPARTVYRIPLS
jgi:hypothetical protein